MRFTFPFGIEVVVGPIDICFFANLLICSLLYPSYALYKSGAGKMITLLSCFPFSVFSPIIDRRICSVFYIVLRFEAGLS